MGSCQKINWPPNWPKPWNISYQIPSSLSTPTALLGKWWLLLVYPHLCWTFTGASWISFNTTSRRRATSMSWRRFVEHRQSQITNWWHEAQWKYCWSGWSSGSVQDYIYHLWGEVWTNTCDQDQRFEPVSGWIHQGYGVGIHWEMCQVPGGTCRLSLFHLCIYEA